MAEPQGQERESTGSLPESVLQRLHSIPGEAEEFHVIKELNEQTHRGLAILGAAYLEWKVREAIKSQLPVEDEVSDRLFGTPDTTGGLGFKNASQLAYCLGLVGKIGLGDLENIAEVRNRFAHRLLVRSFESEKVREKCLQLKSLDEIARQTPALSQFSNAFKDQARNRFLVTIHFLGSMLSRSAAHNLQQRSGSPKLTLLSGWFW